MHYLVHTAKKKNGKPLKARATSEYMRKLLNLSYEKFGPLPFFDVLKKGSDAGNWWKGGLRQLVATKFGEAARSGEAGANQASPLYNCHMTWLSKALRSKGSKESMRRAC